MHPIRDFLARRRIKGMFGKYVSPALVDQLVKSGATPKLGGENREITAFFGSIHSFVTLAEQVPLAQLPELMNAYCEVCDTEIEAEHGTLDKYIGDVVVAAFGTPQTFPDHALRACVAALKIQHQITLLRERLQAEQGKWPEMVRGLRVRIGINSGPAIVGWTGTATRFNFMMMGDNVNLAARLETGAKEWGVWTLCTGATKSACEQAHKDRIVFRSLGQILVKGRRDPVELFEPVAFSEEATADLRECLRLFDEGLARFRNRDWDRAVECFRESGRLERHQPGTSPGVVSNPSIVFSQMAAACRLNPPPPDTFLA